jgi:hypothetical protein
MFLGKHRKQGSHFEFHKRTQEEQRRKWSEWTEPFFHVKFTCNHYFKMRKMESCTQEIFQRWNDWFFYDDHEGREESFPQTTNTWRRKRKSRNGDFPAFQIMTSLCFGKKWFSFLKYISSALTIGEMAQHHLPSSYYWCPPRFYIILWSTFCESM